MDFFNHKRAQGARRAYTGEEELQVNVEEKVGCSKKKGKVVDLIKPITKNSTISLIRL